MTMKLVLRIRISVESVCGRLMRLLFSNHVSVVNLLNDEKWVVFCIMHYILFMKRRMMMDGEKI